MPVHKENQDKPEGSYQKLDRVLGTPLTTLAGGQKTQTAVDDLANPGLNDSRAMAQFKGFMSGASHGVTPETVANALAMILGPAGEAKSSVPVLREIIALAKAGGKAMPAAAGVANAALATRAGLKAADSTLPTDQRIQEGIQAVIGLAGTAGNVKAFNHPSVHIPSSPAPNFSAGPIQPVVSGEPGMRVVRAPNTEEAAALPKNLQKKLNTIPTTTLTPEQESDGAETMRNVMESKTAPILKKATKNQVSSIDQSIQDTRPSMSSGQAVPDPKDVGGFDFSAKPDITPDIKLTKVKPNTVIASAKPDLEPQSEATKAALAKTSNKKIGNTQLTQERSSAKAASRQETTADLQQGKAEAKLGDDAAKQANKTISDAAAQAKIDQAKVGLKEQPPVVTERTVGPVKDGTGQTVTTKFTLPTPPKESGPTSGGQGGSKSFYTDKMEAIEAAQNEGKNVEKFRGGYKLIPRDVPFSTPKVSPGLPLDPALQTELGIEPSPSAPSPLEGTALGKMMAAEATPTEPVVTPTQPVAPTPPSGAPVSDTRMAELAQKFGGKSGEPPSVAAQPLPEVPTEVPPVEPPPTPEVPQEPPVAPQAPPDRFGKAVENYNQFKDSGVKNPLLRQHYGMELSDAAQQAGEPVKFPASDEGWQSYIDKKVAPEIEKQAGLRVAPSEPVSPVPTKPSVGPPRPSEPTTTPKTDTLAQTSKMREAAAAKRAAGKTPQAPAQAESIKPQLEASLAASPEAPPDTPTEPPAIDAETLKGVEGLGALTEEGKTGAINGEPTSKQSIMDWLKSEGGGRLKGESGYANTDVLLRTFGGVGGGLLGYREDPLGNKPLSALTFGALGASAPDLVEKGAPYLAETLPKVGELAKKGLDNATAWRASSMLSHVSLAKKMLADGAGLGWAAIDDPHRIPGLLQGLTDGRGLIRNFKAGLTSTSPETLTGAESFIKSPKNPLSWIGRAMSGATNATKGVMATAKMSPADQAYYTLTNEPTTRAGKAVLDLNRKLPVLRNLNPYARVMVNRFEQGWERSPLSLLDFANNPGTKEQNMQKLWKMASGTAAASAAAQLTPEDWAKNNRLKEALIVAATGGAGLPVLMGMELGSNWNSKDPSAAGMTEITKDAPDFRLMTDAQHPKAFLRNYLSSYTQGLRPIADWVNPEKVNVSGDDLTPFQKMFYQSASNLPGIKGMLPKEGETNAGPLNQPTISQSQPGSPDNQADYLKALGPH